ncbi:hypothetical protein [Streptosporangium carneum]|uniref:Uncharacterized protein n=1 Tax=Streptosporangium carneum TaxID=47481 RepID=A0A9W6MDU4_9ACTN|nr:hypothetical protein [Streptosporangium carneum]GLK10869.1 hypothetical protein GCM10017600_42750 [Streptosporangium carneum]
MAGRKARLAALTVGLISLFAISGGIANAESGRTYRVSYQGPFEVQSTCNASSAALHEPPDAYTASCFYSATGVPRYSILPGWYFRYVYSID